MFKFKTLAVAATAATVWCAAFGATPKYVFLFIGDGLSVPQRMTAEEFSRKSGAGSLAMNSLPFSAMTRTCSADSLLSYFTDVFIASFVGLAVIGSFFWKLNHNKLSVSTIFGI